MFWGRGLREIREPDVARSLSVFIDWRANAGMLAGKLYSASSRVEAIVVFS